MGFFLVIAMVLVKGGGGLLTLNPPPECYESCMSQTLGEMGCEFDDVDNFLLTSADCSYRAGVELGIPTFWVLWSDAWT